MPNSGQPAADLQGLIEQALILSQQMFEAAGSADWERLIALESERQPLLPMIFAEELRALPEQSALQLQEMLDLDRQTVALSAQGRDQLGRELRTIAQGRQATNAYTKSQG